MSRRWISIDPDVTNAEFAALPDRDRHALFSAMKAYRLEVASGYVIDGYGDGPYRIKPSNGSQGRCLFFTKVERGGVTVLVALLAYKKETRKTPAPLEAKARVMEKDYLDELIEAEMARDPKFAAEWPSVEAALELAALRQRMGLTQKDVAERMGVARPRVAEIEKDPGRASYARVARYAAALGAKLAVVPTDER